MVEFVPTALAALAVLLAGVALALMTVGNLFAAGVCFLGASAVIYLRETWCR
jgi:hypothetical protein